MEKGIFRIIGSYACIKHSILSKLFDKKGSFSAQFEEFIIGVSLVNNYTEYSSLFLNGSQGKTFFHIRRNYNIANKPKGKYHDWIMFKKNEEGYKGSFYIVKVIDDRLEIILNHVYYHGMDSEENLPSIAKRLNEKDFAHNISYDAPASTIEVFHMFMNNLKSMDIEEFLGDVKITKEYL